MSRSTDKTATRRNPGVGINPTAMCMGCNKPKSMAGGRGKGVLWRCVQCLSKRLVA